VRPSVSAKRPARCVAVLAHARGSRPLGPSARGQARLSPSRADPSRRTVVPPVHAARPPARGRLLHVGEPLQREARNEATPSGAFSSIQWRNLLSVGHRSQLATIFLPAGGHESPHRQALPRLRCSTESRLSSAKTVPHARSVLLSGRAPGKRVRESGRGVRKRTETRTVAGRRRRSRAGCGQRGLRRFTDSSS
jgi:hypothetical protein